MTTPDSAADAVAHDARRPECVHCGFCLPACPTYEALGTEADSPRGRLHLMDALDSGRVAPTEAVLRHLDLCLGCRACETACPSGVPYGHELEAARERWHRAPARPFATRLLEGLVTRAMSWPSAVQRVGFAAMRTMARLPGARQLVPGALARLVTSGEPCSASLPQTTPAVGERRLRVGLLLGCVNRWMFGHVNEATARLLSSAGCEVVVPPGQRCCGALDGHSGRSTRARALARRNIAAFEEVGQLDAVVVNAAGCGAAMKEYGDWLADDGAWAARAKATSDKTRDALELLDELGLPSARRPVDAQLAYHDACHLAHVQGVRDAPRRLLAQVPGLTLVPLRDADRCCGSAGIYNVLHPEEADAVLAPKLANLADSGASVVAAANPGCLMHIAAGARRRGMDLTVRHPLEILDEACRP